MRLLLIQHSKVDVRTSHTSIKVEKKDWSEHAFSHIRTKIIQENTDQRKLAFLQRIHENN